MGEPSTLLNIYNSTKDYIWNLAAAQPVETDSDVASGADDTAQTHANTDLLDKTVTPCKKATPSVVRLHQAPMRPGQRDDGDTEFTNFMKRPGFGHDERVVRELGYAFDKSKLPDTITVRMQISSNGSIAVAELPEDYKPPKGISREEMNHIIHRALVPFSVPSYAVPEASRTNPCAWITHTISLNPTPDPASVPNS